MKPTFNKALLIPILTAVFLLVKQIFNVDLPEQTIDIASDVIMGLVTLSGFFLHPVTVNGGGPRNGTEESKPIIENNR